MRVNAPGPESVPGLTIGETTVTSGFTEPGMVEHSSCHHEPEVSEIEHYDQGDSPLADAQLLLQLGGWSKVPVAGGKPKRPSDAGAPYDEAPAQLPPSPLKHPISHNTETGSPSDNGGTDRSSEKSSGSITNSEKPYQLSLTSPLSRWRGLGRLHSSSLVCSCRICETSMPRTVES